MGWTGVIETNWLYKNMTEGTFFLSSQKWKKPTGPKRKKHDHIFPFWQGVGDISYSLSRTNQETARWFWLRHERRAGILWTRPSVCRRLRSYVLGLSSSVVGLKAKVNLFYFTWRIIPLVVYPIVFQGYIHPFGGWPWNFWTINSG